VTLKQLVDSQHAKQAANAITQVHDMREVIPDRVRTAVSA